MYAYRPLRRSSDFGGGSTPRVAIFLRLAAIGLVYLRLLGAGREERW